MNFGSVNSCNVVLMSNDPHLTEIHHFAQILQELGVSFRAIFSGSDKYPSTKLFGGGTKTIVVTPSLEIALSDDARRVYQNVDIVYIAPFFAASNNVNWNTIKQVLCFGELPALELARLGANAITVIGPLGLEHQKNESEFTITWVTDSDDKTEQNNVSSLVDGSLLVVPESVNIAQIAGKSSYIMFDKMSNNFAKSIVFGCKPIYWKKTTKPENSWAAQVLDPVPVFRRLESLVNIIAEYDNYSCALWTICKKLAAKELNPKVEVSKWWATQSDKQ